MVRHALGDERGFVHKKIFGGIKGAVGGFLGGGPGGALGGAIKGFTGKPSVSLVPQASAGCPPGFTVGPSGNCVPSKVAAFRFARARGPEELALFQFREERAKKASGASFAIQQPDVTGAEGQLLPFGEAVMGRFGAGLKPAVFSQQRRACPRGSVLGAPEADGSSLCYNKRDISNRERAWPRGRRPLLTGGEMRAISTASAAAKKLQRKQKQLEQLGLLKKPAPRTRRALPAGHKAELVHSG